MKKRKKPTKKPKKRKKTAVKNPRGRPRTKEAQGRASRERGKRGERDARDLWRQHGFLTAERTVQVKGGTDASDIIIPGVSHHFHAEVKNVETFHLYPSLHKAADDAGLLKIPFVMHKRNGQDFCVILDAEEFIALMKKAGYTPHEGRLLLKEEDNEIQL